MSVTLDQVHKFHDEIRAGRITRDSLQRFLENPNRYHADLGRWGKYWPVDIDYSRSLEIMVKVCKLDGYINPDCKNFSLTHKGKRVINLELAEFDETVTGKDAAGRLEVDGYVVEDFGALLAFGASYPNEQRRRPIVALGSRWQDSDGRVRVPCLDRGGSDRRLDLHCFERGFGPFCQLLVSRK